MRYILSLIMGFTSLICSWAQPLSSMDTLDTIKPVTPQATPEAQALLSYIYSISGKYTLTGQHCPPLLGSTRLSVVHRQTGQYPAIFGQDFGFSYPGYWDGINYRQQVVDEAIRRHKEGFIITLMWHAVPPTMDEPVPFEGGIQSKLSEADWDSLVTPGSSLHERWKSQVDVIAWFLKQLHYAKVPVIWRPYHEMNGGWFWWGKKTGETGYKQLYRMMFERLVAFHGLTNLLWVFNTNEVTLGVDDHPVYYPGDRYVDIIATDIYRTGYTKETYKQLIALAKDKPIALGEVGHIPPAEVLKKQDRWVWFMQWHDPATEERGKDWRKIFAQERVKGLYDLPWVSETESRVHHPILRN